jgi:hypothetical protein
MRFVILCRDSPRCSPSGGAALNHQALDWKFLFRLSGILQKYFAKKVGNFVQLLEKGTAILILGT